MIDAGHQKMPPLPDATMLCLMQRMDTAPGLPGAAHLVLAPGVIHLDPESAIFEAMLEGWARQQRVRFLTTETITSRVNLVRRLAVFSNQYPWQWQIAEY